VNARGRLAGSLLCVGFDGGTAASPVIGELAALGPGGVVLFARNVSTPARARELVDGIRSALGDVVVAVDQEGGRVARFRRDFPALPSAMAVAAAGDPADAELLAFALAVALRRAGVDLNFAPVADLALDPRSTVIGTRAYSAEPERAATFVAATVCGLQRGGAGATLKHFPGHGATAVDSHVALPVLAVDAATLRGREFVPFAAGIAAGARAVMIGHLVVPALDPERPASLSPSAIAVLRGELGFSGAIVTDCLQMDAIASGVGTVRAAVLALAAGADQARDAIVAAIESGELSEAALVASAARVATLRGGAESASAPSDVPALAARVARAAIAPLRGEARLPRDKPVNIVSFEGAIADGVAPDAGSERRLHLALRRRRFQAESLRVALSPSTDVLENLLALVRAQRERSLVIVMRRAHLHETQAQAIDALLALVPEAILVSALEPFDAARFPQAATLLCLYGDDELMIDALADLLAGAS
jgi:beta-N-acetylhexosaminidase